LGSPGSGCSTLLKILANHRAGFHEIKGNVQYDSFTPEKMAKHHRGDLSYCPEDDVHFPTLTVDETLRFAAKMRTPQNRLQGTTRKNYMRTMTDVLETLFGLTHAKKTPVGDNRIRGVSGGEKKRVSIAEALATRALLGSWDNSTRGLDASTALEFVRALRIATDVARLTTIVSIYQAGEQLYEVFDKVCVIYEGRMAYFGPANEARQYFIDMGFEPANRQTTADFLVTCTDPNGRTRRKDFSGPSPNTALEFADHFRDSKLGKRNMDDMKSYRGQFAEKPQRASMYIESTQDERAKRTREGSPYTLSIPMQARAVMIRRLQILKGSAAEQIIQLA
jgi:ATP-binding cassette subfamily G (WHITE) protein 2 (SNQ2)